MTLLTYLSIPRSSNSSLLTSTRKTCSHAFLPLSVTANSCPPPFTVAHAPSRSSSPPKVPRSCSASPTLSTVPTYFPLPPPRSANSLSRVPPPFAAVNPYLTMTTQNLNLRAKLPLSLLLRRATSPPRCNLFPYLCILPTIPRAHQSSSPTSKANFPMPPTSCAT